MNINENKIEGIGLIKNVLVYNRTHKIHENNEYNRYIYQGKYWLSRTQILAFNFEILNIFDDILFKGKSHLKNKIGIRIITDNLFVHWPSYDLITLKNKVKNVFLHYFQKKEEEYFEIVPNLKKKDAEGIGKEDENKEYFEIVPNIKIKKKDAEDIGKEDENKEYFEIVPKIKVKKREKEEEYFEIVPNIKIKKKEKEDENEEYFEIVPKMKMYKKNIKI
jgi:hypothetical protein